MGKFEIVEYSEVKKKFASIKRRKVLTEEQILKNIAEVLAKNIEENKRKVFVFDDEDKTFILTVKYGNVIAYAVKGSAKNEAEAQRNALEYVRLLREGKISDEEKRKIRKAIQKLQDRLEKSRESKRT